MTSEIGLQGLANSVQIPKEYVLLNRMVTLLLGICNTLDSSINPIEVVRPYFQTFMIGDKEQMVTYVKDFVKNSATTLLTIPKDLGDVLNKAKRGKLEINMQGEVEKTKLLYALGQQMIYTILMISSFGFSYLFFQNEQEVWAKWGIGVSIFFGFLFLRALRKGRKIKRTL